MGLFGRKGKWRTIRENYQDLPKEEWTDDEHNHWWQNLSEEEYWQTWEEWSQQTELHPSVRKIRRPALAMAMEAARETDGRAREDAQAAGRGMREDGGETGAEFACLLRIEADTITELVLLPGTVSGDEHAIFDLWMQPIDKDVRGSLHSHPDEHPYPSEADLELFDYQGEVHLILCRPYGPDNWRAYDHTGVPIKLEVVD